jgi:hypothetical protein
MTTKQQRPFGQFALIVAELAVLGLCIAYLVSLTGNSQLCRLIEFSAPPVLILSFTGIDCWALKTPAQKARKADRVKHETEPTEVELATSTV